MLITEWQEKFLQLVTEGKYNVFPPAMIKALLAEEADYTKWTAMAEKFFSRYEGLTITISGHNEAEKRLTPAALWWDIDLIAEPAPEGLLMESSNPINGENSTTITEE